MTQQPQRAVGRGVLRNGAAQRTAGTRGIGRHCDVVVGIHGPQRHRLAVTLEVRKRGRVTQHAETALEGGVALATLHQPAAGQRAIRSQVPRPRAALLGKHGAQHTRSADPGSPTGLADLPRRRVEATPCGSVNRGRGSRPVRRRLCAPKPWQWRPTESTTRRTRRWCAPAARRRATGPRGAPHVVHSAGVRCGYPDERCVACACGAMSVSLRRHTLRPAAWWCAQAPCGQKWSGEGPCGGGVPARSKTVTEDVE